MFALSGNILVVDEGSGFCRNLAAKLAGRGYRVDFTFDVPSAAAKLVAKEVDLVVLSCAGEIPCQELIQQVKELCADIPIISFDVPQSQNVCYPPENSDAKIVTLGSWNIVEATQAVSDCIETVVKKAGDATLSNQLLFGQGKQVDIQILGVHKTGMLSSSIVRRDDKYLYLSEIKDITGRTYTVPVRTSLKVGVAGKDAHYNFTSQVISIAQEPEILIQMGKPVVIYRTQRRKHPRFPMKIPVRVSAYCDDSDTDSLCTDGLTEDISRAGIKLTVPEYIEPGEVITVDIPNESKKANIKGLAYVLRTTPDPTSDKSGYTLACRFSKIDDSISTLLKAE